MYGVAKTNGFVLPITHTTILNELRRDFCLRRQEEPGLSVIVPYLRSEVTVANIIQAVAREYFYPILHEKLTVVVESPDFSKTLDSNNLRSSIESDDLDLQGDLRSIVDFTCDIRSRPPRQERLHPPQDKQLKWSESIFPEESLNELASRFARGEHIALRVPVTVRRASGEVQQSCSAIWHHLLSTPAVWPNTPLARPPHGLSWPS
jgi:hypothetical protein